MVNYPVFFLSLSAWTFPTLRGTWGFYLNQLNLLNHVLPRPSKSCRVGGWCKFLPKGGFQKKKSREHNQAKTVEIEGEHCSFVLKTAVFCCWKVELVLNQLTTFQFLLSTFNFQLSTVHYLLSTFHF